MCCSGRRPGPSRRLADVIEPLGVLPIVRHRAAALAVPAVLAARDRLGQLAIRDRLPVLQ